MDGEGVPHIMQARLMSGIGTFAYDVGTDPQAAEGHLGVLRGHRSAAAGDEEGRRCPGMLLSAPCGIWGQDPQQVIADRHQSALVELALADAVKSLPIPTPFSRPIVTPHRPLPRAYPRHA